jgi:hypothetical protein
VRIDYGGHYAQLRYKVWVNSPNPPFTLSRATFEGLFWAGNGDWDFIVEENLSDSIQLLSELVTYLAELPRRLPLLH